MSSSAWVLMDDDCDCGPPPPLFHLPPPPVPPDLPCEIMDMACPNSLGQFSDTEVKKIGTVPSVTVIVVCCLSAVILLVIACIVYVKIKKTRKGVAQTKDFDHHHHGPSMMNGNGVLYEDLAHARPRPPMAPPIEMLDVNHHTLGANGMIGNSKLDFSYFLNPPPIYEELPDHSDRNNGPSGDEFAEDELSVIDVPISQQGDPNLQSRYHNAANRASKPRAQSLTRKRPSKSGGGGGGFKSQRSLDRRGRNGVNGSVNKYSDTGTTPRPYGRHQMDPDNASFMLMLSKIPPHLVAVLAESAFCNGVGRPYEVIANSGIPLSHMQLPGTPTSMGNGCLVNSHGNGVTPAGGVYPSSRSSGSSYGEGGSSSNSSARNNPGGNSIESSSFDSGIGPHSITSFINSPAYEQTMLPPAYAVNAYDFSTSINPHFLTSQQQQNLRRLRMTPADREHPLYSNHLLT